MSLAPHDAELVEADAFDMWRACSDVYGGGSWANQPDGRRDLFRRLAADPYRYPGLVSYPPPRDGPPPGGRVPLPRGRPVSVPPPPLPPGWHWITEDQLRQLAGLGRRPWRRAILCAAGGFLAAQLAALALRVFLA